MWAWRITPVTSCQEFYPSSTQNWIWGIDQCPCYVSHLLAVNANSWPPPSTPSVNRLRKSNAGGCVPMWSKMLSISLLLENIIRRIFGRSNAKFLVKLVEYLWQIWVRNFLWRDYKNNHSSQVNNAFNATIFVIVSTLIFTDYDKCMSEKLKGL